MRRFYLMPLLLLGLLTGCGEKPVGTVEGHAPRVALVPIIDRTSNHEVTWNLSQELTSLLQRNLMRQTGLDVREAKHAQLAHNPFGEKLDWMKKNFGKSEFVVFAELIRHEQTPRGHPSSEADADYLMDMRIRLVDLRHRAPRVILQEIISESTHIERPFTKWNFSQIPWGEAHYDLSPTAAAHAQLTERASERLRNYVRLALAL